MLICANSNTFVTTKKMRKKTLLAILLLIALGVEIGGQAAKVETSSKPTIVIVHGAWGGGWAFKKVETLLRQKGFDVYRPQLTGQGDRVRRRRAHHDAFDYCLAANY